MPRKDQSHEKIERGYRPLNEGYTAKEQRGYIPIASGARLPKAPTGGTGESAKPASTTRPRSVKR